MRGNNCEICGRNTLVFAYVPKRMIGDTSVLKNVGEVEEVEEVPMCENCIEKINKGLIKWG